MFQQPVIEHRLPKGIVLTSDGRLVGHPLEVGTFQVTLSVLSDGVVGEEYKPAIEAVRVPLTIVIDKPLTLRDRIRVLWFRLWASEGVR